MKKLLVILAIIPAMLIAQQTYVPDDNFEQVLIDLGYDTPPLNDSVPTKNIDTVTKLVLYNNGIFDLTGIEDFTTLEWFGCSSNYIVNIDLSRNFYLKHLGLGVNRLLSLDLSNNKNLEWLDVSDNRLVFLNLKNGNNDKMNNCRNSPCMNAWLNSNLTCIQVDDSIWSETNEYWIREGYAHYSEDCGYTGVEDNKFENNDVSVSPNPASDYIEIGGVEGVNGVMIYDVLGNVVLSLGDSRFRGNDMRGVENDILVSSEGNVRIDVSALPKGVYFVSVGGRMYKFVKI